MYPLCDWTREAGTNFQGVTFVHQEVDVRLFTHWPNSDVDLAIPAMPGQIVFSTDPRAPAPEAPEAPEDQAQNAKVCASDDCRCFELSLPFQTRVTECNFPS